MDVRELKIEVFPGRLLVERELMPHEGLIINPKGRQRRRNKGKVIECSGVGRFKNGDDVFFMARRGTIIGDNALIDENDVLLQNMMLIGDRVLIEPIEEKKVTDSGIIIPDTAQEYLMPQRGYARVIGDEMPVAKSGIREGEPKIQEGDELIFRKDAGIILEKDGIQMLVMRVQDIYAVL